jgi:hypothetical protein
MSGQPAYPAGHCQRCCCWHILQAASCCEALLLLLLLLLLVWGAFAPFNCKKPQMHHKHVKSCLWWDLTQQLGVCVYL